MSPVRSRTRGTATRRLCAIVVAAGALGIASAQAIDAQEFGAAQVRLHVTELTGVLGPGTIPPPEDDTLDPEEEPDPPTTLQVRVLVENRGEFALDAGRLVVEVYPSVASRAELQEAMEGEFDGDPVLVDDPGIRDGSLGPGDIAGLDRSYEEELIPWAEGGGVHPVRIAVIRGTEVLDEVMTAIVWLSDPPTNPISSVLVWPLDEAPWRSIGGTYPVDADVSTRDGERLDDLLRVLERHPSAPIVLAPAPHLLEDLRDRADGFTVLDRGDPDDEGRHVVPEAADARHANDVLRRLRDVARELPYPPVTTTYAGADLSALHATEDRGARDLASDVAAAGRLRLQVELGRAPDGATHLVTDGLVPPVLDLLPGDQLLVPHDATVPPSGRGGSSPHEEIQRLRSPAGRSLLALVSDPDLSDLVSRPTHSAGPQVGVQRVVAETAMLHLERPAASGRSLLLFPDPGWDPGLVGGSLLVERLTELPWLELRDVSSTIADGRRSSALFELTPPEAPSFPAGFEAELTTAIAELRAARGMLPDDATTIDGRTPAELEDALVRSTSRWLRSDTQRVGHQLVGDVRASLAAFFGELTLSRSSVTLTSDAGQIPVTVQRPSGEPILVQLQIASGGQLSWPEGRHSQTLRLDEGSSVTVTFDTEAQSTGTFPVVVTVTDPAGGFELRRTELAVRSTAISGPALAGISAVVVVLLLIGALRRRRSTPGLKVVGSEDDVGGGRREPSDQPY